MNSSIHTRAHDSAPSRLVSICRFLVVAALLATGIVIGSDVPTAEAAGTPDISVTAATEAVLYGEDIAITLTASNPGGPNGFNLSFQDVLPVGVTYVDGSASPEPDVYDMRPDGTTALVWNNIADLLTGTEVNLTYSIRPDTAVFDATDIVTTAPKAFVHDDSRVVPDFDADGDVIVDVDSSYSGNDATTSSTELLPFRLTKGEPSAEQELLRGVHDQQTVFTLTVDNNLVNATNDFSIIDYVPAGMEFLGCGTVDNTTDAATTGQEYPGSGVINPGNAPALANPCPIASSVTTVTTDPDGAGPMPSGVYTRVEWDSASLAAALGSDDLAASASFQIDYVAAIPLRENVQATLTDPTANLDNNTGPLTADEQLLQNYAVATGDYQSVLNAPSTETSETIFDTTVEDVALVKSVDTPTFVQGSTSTWTLTIRTSEYATSTGTVVVTDTLPDGLDFDSSVPAIDGGFPVTNGDGTLTLQWTLPANAASSATQTIELDTTARLTYRNGGAPVSSNDSWNNTASLTTDVALMTDNDGSTTSTTIVDDASASQSTTGVVIAKDVAEPEAGTMTCGDGSALTFDPELAGDYRPGDRVCWRLTVTFPGSLDTLDPVVFDYLPEGFVYESWAPGENDSGTGAASTFAAIAGGEDGDDYLQWTLPTEVDELQVFEVVVQSTATPGAGMDEIGEDDILENLMKLRYENTDGSVFQLREQADVTWIEAELTLAKNVLDVDDSPPVGSPPQVENGDTVTYRVSVSNGGSLDALDVDIRDNLPDGITCADVVALSITGGGTCNGASDRIEWPSSLNITVATGATVSFTYDVLVPDTIAAGTTLTNTAGIRTYEAVSNDDDERFTYIPSENIDTSLEATSNTDPADDDASVQTDSPTIDKTRTTGIDEAGNAASNEATIGETIDYTVTLTLPGGTTYYSDGSPITLTDDLPATLDLVTAVAPVLTRNAITVGAPDGFTIATNGTDDSVTVTFPLDGDDSYKVANGTPETFVLTFQARVIDAGGPVRGNWVNNTANFDYETADGTPQNVNDNVGFRVVEPNIQLAKTENDADDLLAPGDEVGYTLTVTNPNADPDGPGDEYVSVAHDLVIVDTVPDSLIVLAASGGAPVTDGGTVGPDGGVWNETARTITWTVTSPAPQRHRRGRLLRRARRPLARQRHDHQRRHRRGILDRRRRRQRARQLAGVLRLQRRRRCVAHDARHDDREVGYPELANRRRGRSPTCSTSRFRPTSSPTT